MKIFELYAGKYYDDYSDPNYAEVSLLMTNLPVQSYKQNFLNLVTNKY